MDQADKTPLRWTPSLMATMLLRIIAATCFVFGTFWFFDWVAYRIQYTPAFGTAVSQDAGYAVWSGRYFLLGGLLLLFEPVFVRWLLGGRMGGGSRDEPAS